MRWLGLITIGVLLAATSAMAQSNSSLPQPNDDRPQSSQGDPRFDPRMGPPPRGPMSEAPFTPRQGYGPPPSYDPRRDERPDPRDARRGPPPPPKSQADRRPPPRDAHRAPPPPPHRDARRDDRRDDRRYDPRYDRRPLPPRDTRDARRDPPRYDDRRPPPRQADRYDPRYDRRGPPPRDYREARREPPRDYRDDRRINPNLSVEHRRALLREYEHNARRQLEIERELSGAPSGPPPRDRYSDAGPPRR